MRHSTVQGSPLSTGPDYGPSPDPLSFGQDNINLILKCFNTVFKLIVLKTFSFLRIKVHYSQHLPHCLTFEVKYMQSMIT